MDHATYLAHLETESQLFRSAIAACDPTALVPNCPDWTAADLLAHMTDVQNWWADVLANRPEAPASSDDEAPRADFDAALLAYDEAFARLRKALDGASPDESAWSWSTNPDHHNVAFIGRRQALEALIHRVDAEQAAAARELTPIDPAFAADGVDEILDVMYGGCPPWGEFNPLPHHVRIDMPDADTSMWVQLGRFSGVDPKDEVSYEEDDIHVVGDPGVEPDAVIIGDAPALLLRLWRRGDGADIRLTGDLAMIDVFRAATRGPIN